MENKLTPEYIAAKNRVETLKKFYRQLAVFAIIAGGFLTYKYMKYGELKFHFSFWIMIWGLVIAIRAVKLFVFDSKWESKQLKKELNKYE